jgi:para-nitrobenzyl esterase
VTFTGQACPSASTQNCFWDIPYATAPTGDLRFSPPTDYSWGSTTDFDATTFGTTCVTGVDTGSEDCLILDIYAPNDAADAAVMVWIHGGCFVSGSSQEYFG